MSFGPGTFFNAAANMCQITCDENEGRRLAPEDGGREGGADVLPPEAAEMLSPVARAIVVQHALMSPTFAAFLAKDPEYVKETLLHLQGLAERYGVPALTSGE